MTKKKEKKKGGPSVRTASGKISFRVGRFWQNKKQNYQAKLYSKEYKAKKGMIFINATKSQKYPDSQKKFTRTGNYKKPEKKIYIKRKK